MTEQAFVSKSQVAAMFGVDARTVTTWQQDRVDPLPVAVQGKRGQAHKYDLCAIHAWGVRRALDSLVENADGTIYNYEKERARLTYEQADKAALENAQMRGNLIAAEVLGQTLVESYANIRAHLLAAPSNHAPFLFDADTVDELRNRLAGVVQDLLLELAVDQLSADAVARIEDAAESAANPEAAAAA